MVEMDPRLWSDRLNEVKLIAVDPRSPQGLAWRVERWGPRFLFIGPLPGRTLFWSCEAGDWRQAILMARDRWVRMPLPMRARWYGPCGAYSNTDYPRFGR